MAADPSTLDPKQALLLSRVIWAAMLMGVVVFGLFVGLIFRGEPEEQRQPLSPQTGYVFLAIAVATLLIGVPVGLFARGEIFKCGWVGDVITPTAYISGNIVVWALCEGAAFFSLVTYMVSHQPLLFIPGGLAVALMLLLWPDGKAMQPRKNADEANPYRAS
jgi:hypothetical protein